MEAAPLPAPRPTNRGELPTLPPQQHLTSQNALSEEKRQPGYSSLLPTITGSTPRAELIALACRSGRPTGWRVSVSGETTTHPNSPRTTRNGSDISRRGNVWLQSTATMGKHTRRPLSSLPAQAQLKVSLHLCRCKAPAMKNA